MAALEPNASMCSNSSERGPYCRILVQKWKRFTSTFDISLKRVKLFKICKSNNHRSGAVLKRKTKREARNVYLLVGVAEGGRGRIGTN